MKIIMEKVKKFINDEGLLQSGDSCLVALSGGADSVALLKILYELKKEYNLRLYSMHIHHGIRDEEAHRDAKFASELSESFGIECIIKYVNVPDYAKLNRLSIEEAARILRYEELQKQAKLKNAKIATAHHLDDKAETFIMNLCRGSGLKGLGSIRAERENIIRPLLALSKKEILDYIEKESLDYVTDSTNLEDIYTRNYIRHKVIPCMEKLNVCSQKHISAAGDEIYEAYKYIKDIAKEKLEKISVYRYEGKITAKESLKSSDRNFSIGIEKEVFDKEPDIIKNAVAVFALDIFLFIVGSMIISGIEGFSLKETMFECASAVATVGLTLGITPHLGIISKILLICMMYIGRVGGITLIFAAVTPKKNGNARYPKDQVAVG